MLPKVDVLIINDEEARELSGEANLVKSSPRDQERSRTQVGL